MTYTRECKQCSKGFDTRIKEQVYCSAYCGDKFRKKLKTGDGIKTYHPLYKRYSLMIRRCHCENSNNYKDYGYRGISVCEEWRSDFWSYVRWAESCNWKPYLQVDRIDNNKGYYPENCRWTTSKVNQRNRRTSRLVEFNGELKTVSEWAEIHGITHGLLSDRLYSQKLPFDIAVQKNKIPSRFSRKIIDTNNGRVFNSITEVSRYYGIKRTTLHMSLKGVNKTNQNFKYYE